MGVKSEFVFFLHNIKFHLSAIMEYRLNFLMQAIGMFLNDVLMVVFWWILFSRFNQMNGWLLNDVLLLFAVVSSAVGISRVLFGSAKRIHRLVSDGGMDYYLTLPKNVLLNCITKIEFNGVGDAAFGFIMGFILLDIMCYAIFLVVVLCAALVLVSFLVIVSSLSFYIGNAESLTDHLEIGIIVTASYPFSLFGGVSRFLLLTILPAGFVGGIPVEIIKSFSYYWFFILLSFALFITVFAVAFFYKGLKRYESGNLIVVRE